MTHATTIDTEALTGKVQEMYRAVARTPQREFHFETGRALAERLGYPPAELDRLPDGAIESFAGVGWFFDLADPREGETVVDLGSGSGMDAFFAALRVGPAGGVVGVDMTDAQLEKAERLRAQHGLGHVTFRSGRIEQLPVEDASVDVVISNGVINLTPDKDRVFREVARVLRPDGRLAIADIVTDTALTDAIVSDVDLWASCIGGAPQQRAYLDAIARAGLRVEQVRPNDYQFLSEQARAASGTYGVRSVSVLARKQAP
ncbi:methyltransferase domain-containing protein [Blastococcus saxobsidens]|uniref:Arsenite methyltransferase n=1 Tax=Blastococcus saxobsidens (strain DD2) TaxID=1146883 RepID=H6RRA4_BLASD|nr:methyltransferase domain-containing protein [Blastococcus saxobsidens]CCG04184.1 putative Methyltransferase type 11 [Blastococcus saxobsidens DD2]